jgi:muramoyltetrapeptide carboxypeptidase
MITPPGLRRGDKIAVVSPAKKITAEEMAPALSRLEAWGFEVVLGQHVFSSDFQFAGTDEQRASDLQKALDDVSVKAILCSRGGYGTVRIIDRLDFNGFRKNPKWLAGFSDVTVLHSHIHSRLGIETIHSLVPLTFPSGEPETPATESLRTALLGEKLSYLLDHHPLSRPGEATGVLTGGNLSILYNLTGTVSDIDTRGKILLIEDVDEYLYHVDRMMMNLKRTGKLSGLRGLVIGWMNRMKDNEEPFGRDAYGIILDAVREYDYPVCFGFPSGHNSDNRALILGRKVRLKVAERTTLSFHHG